MNIRAKVTLGALAVLLGGVALALLRFGGVTRRMCANEVVAELPAPDKRRRAVVFQRDCGATTGFSTQVSVLDASESLPNEGGNVFVADTDHGQAPAGPGGGPPVEVRWISNADLEVHHHVRARVFAADTLVDGVRIRFVTIAPPGA